MAQLSDGISPAIKSGRDPHGATLYEAKKKHHKNIHLFPSSIDKEHFSRAREKIREPEDQAVIPPLRLGFYGVIDERFDIALIDEVAEKHPDWQFVFIGPVVKIDPATLPTKPNIHYLGSKDYTALPAYLAGWDIALLPFARNESTRFISPTKTPEYLAGGKPVISTSIADVVMSYGEKELVHIADTANEFTHAAEKIFAMEDKRKWLQKVDDFLRDLSWDNTWNRMNKRIGKELGRKHSDAKTSDKQVVYV